jgi:hypothetical protein
VNLITEVVGDDDGQEPSYEAACSYWFSNLKVKISYYRNSLGLIFALASETVLNPERE